MITPTVDLRGQLLPVRHQGRRQSCLAFATSCAHEAKIATGDPLSVEYLFFHAATRLTTGATRGLTLAAAAEALLNDGQPPEPAWPYTALAVDPWIVPMIAPPFHKATLVPGQANFDWIVAALDAGRPVVLGLVITEAFYRPDTLGVVDDGNVVVPRGGHAVLAVGHGAAAAGQPALLIRNSWGDRWGLNGHAWLPQTYVRRQLRETALVT